ncbi:hypothetical protein A1O3_03551 [Capronia epimyces CBS 606.96]|uniref:Uncharacterized protein n=1 Tax=Capronia epimyces CBS 606.96 TaxID=1182542 RepID=W9Y273_9EURO|nr:uncharacterized protein A1O3_03551 [Capronia epimyces CBS 606.96]EXJ86598.1 hypothetical protein A1O3_03551 [Capronia epimyces CBS 606.96]
MFLSSDPATKAPDGHDSDCDDGIEEQHSLTTRHPRPRSQERRPTSGSSLTQAYQNNIPSGWLEEQVHPGSPEADPSRSAAVKQEVIQDTAEVPQQPQQETRSNAFPSLGRETRDPFDTQNLPPHLATLSESMTRYQHKLNAIHNALMSPRRQPSYNSDFYQALPHGLPFLPSPTQDPWRSDSNHGVPFEDHNTATAGEAMRTGAYVDREDDQRFESKHPLEDLQGYSTNDPGAQDSFRLPSPLEHSPPAIKTDRAGSAETEKAIGEHSPDYTQHENTPNLLVGAGEYPTDNASPHETDICQFRECAFHGTLRQAQPDLSRERHSLAQEQVRATSDVDEQPPISAQDQVLDRDLVTAADGNFTVPRNLSWGINSDSIRRFEAEVLRKRPDMTQQERNEALLMFHIREQARQSVNGGREPGLEPGNSQVTSWPSSEMPGAQTSVPTCSCSKGALCTCSSGSCRCGTDGPGPAVSPISRKATSTSSGPSKAAVPGSPLRPLSNKTDDHQTGQRLISRPDTPRPLPESGPSTPFSLQALRHSIRQSVEPELPHPNWQRESTPGYEDRSATPSPLSRQGVDVNADVDMPDAPDGLAQVTLGRQASLPPSMPHPGRSRSQSPDKPATPIRNPNPLPPVPPIPGSGSPLKQPKRADRRKSAAAAAVQGAKVDKRSVTATATARLGASKPKSRNVTRKATASVGRLVEQAKAEKMDKAAAAAAGDRDCDAEKTKPTAGSKVAAAVEKIEQQVRDREQEETGKNVILKQKDGTPVRRSQRANKGTRMSLD